MTRPRSSTTRLPSSLASLALAVSASAFVAGCDGAGADHDGHGTNRGAHHEHSEGDEHAMRIAAFEFLDPQHPAHANWVDLGEIPIGDVVEHVVRMKNVEGRPITFESIQAGCSCTKPVLACVTASGERIEGRMRESGALLTAPPDSIVELHLRVDSEAAPIKNKDKIVIVRMSTDSPSTPYITVEVRMRIHAPLQPIPPDIDLKRLGVNSGGEGQTDITPMAPTGEQVLGVLESPEGVSARIEPVEISGVPLWRLHVRVEPPVRLGYQESYVKLRTSGPGGEGEGPPLSVKLRFTGAEDLEITPLRMMFVRPSPDMPEQATGMLVSHMPGQRVRVVSHSIDGRNVDGLMVRVTPVSPDDDGRAARWNIAVEAPADSKGAIEGVLKIELDDAQYPRLEAQLTRRS